MEATMTFDVSEPSAPAVGAEYLTFFIAGEEYAVTLERVREVIPYDTITRVPGMPAPIRGVTNLRGSVVPVIDLAIKFRLSEIPLSARTCIVLVELPLNGLSLLVGLLTEAVGQVLSLAAGELVPPPAFGAPIRTDFLRGMAQVGKKFALVLDIDRVLSAAELSALNEPSSTAEPALEPNTAASAADLDTTWDATPGSDSPRTPSPEADAS
jgi:purine-binding chemotaxis protein CheW